MRLTMRIFATTLAFLFQGLCLKAQAQRTTWLMHDQIVVTGKLVCSSGNCDHDGMGKNDQAKLLPGVPLKMNAGPNYNANGYWHVVINTLEAAKSSPCGRAGTVRILINGISGRWAYYNGALAGYGDATMQLGKATVISQKFDAWKGMIGTYEKICKESDFDNDIARWTLGPIPTPVFSCTPLKQRFRVYLTLDPKFKPPTDPNDPVGMQPGGATSVTPRVPLYRQAQFSSGSPTLLLTGRTSQEPGNQFSVRRQSLSEIRGSSLSIMILNAQN